MFAMPVYMGGERNPEHEPIGHAVVEIYERLGSHELDPDRATNRVFELLKEAAGVRRGHSVRRAWPRRTPDC